MPERIVVVGHSAVTCLGRDLEATWRGLIAGRSGIRRLSAMGPEAFLQDIGGRVDDFGPGSASEDPDVSRLSARSIHLAMAAARAAWADAGLDRAGRLRPRPGRGRGRVGVRRASTCWRPSRRGWPAAATWRPAPTWSPA